MTRFKMVLLASTAFCALVISAPAQAAPFRDSVYKPSQASASQLSTWRFTAPDGHQIRLRLSDSIGRNAASDARAQSYALLLEDGLHAYEMSRLTITVVRANELAQFCGEGALACYGGDEMVVPYGELNGGVSVEEVVRHEYGHHLAAYRRNSLGRAIDWGPQTWASTESVCYRADGGQLFPGDQWDHYWDNPGEAFAEAYARYHHGNDTWDYSRLLRPTRKSFDSVAFDSTHQLSKAPSSTVFEGSLGYGRRSQTFTLDLAQDTRLNLALSGPGGANYDLRLQNKGYYDETTRGRGASDKLNTAACFGQGVRKTVRIRVTRKSGSGAFRLRANYWDRYDALG